VKSPIDPVEQAALAADLKRAAESGQVLNFNAADIVKWARAVDWLIALGELPAARYATGQMLAAGHDLAYARNVKDVLDRLPEADAEILSFRDNLESEVQVVQRKSADTVILVFGAYAHGAGIALSIAHRWFGRLAASLIYLRDFRHLYFRDGIPSLGKGREATIARLRELIGSLGARRVACYGYSAGAFAALHYGVDLSADFILAISGPYSLTPDILLRASVRSEAYRRHPISEEPVNLRELFGRAAAPPQTLLLYGDRNPIDRFQAEYMAGARNVRLHAIENCDTHLAVVELIRRGAFASLLRWLVGEPTEALAGARGALAP
jgi:hypothetical protein